MSATATGRRSPPSGISINLASNNPFRNRNNLNPSPLNSPDPRMSRFPMAHNNPFLDANELASTSSGPSPAPAPIGVAKSANIAVPNDIFNDLSLLDKPAKSSTLPVSSHRTHISEDRRERSRGPPTKANSPGKPAQRHQRRASESSIMEKDRRPREQRDRSDRPPRTESEERRRRERRREREERHRKEKDAGARGTRTRRPQGLDIIDKLDVTGVYGQGLFHHDGPFDACNPHRNAKKDRRAPMQAFPADSANMRLGGFGPVRDRLDLDAFHGRTAEGFNDYSTTLRRGPATTVIDPTARIEPVHGEETHGLGTSTFLEGAPASKNALRRESGDYGTEPLGNPGGAGGLGRKKSLAQRFRGMSGTRPQYRPPVTDQSSPPLPTDASSKSLSAGGPARARHANKQDEINPFFEAKNSSSTTDYNSAFEKKGAQIRIAEKELEPSSSSAERPKTSAGRSYSHNNSNSTSDRKTPSSHVRASSNPRGAEPTRAAPPPPPNALVRTLTNEQRGDGNGSGSSSEFERSGGGAGGFLKRMRSLKGRQ